jgi:hypothetical protein
VLTVSAAVYALIGVLLGSAIPALAAVWQGRQASQQAERERDAASAQARNDHRVSLIASWREGLAATVAETGQEVLTAQQNPLFVQSWYMSLRPHLSDKARAGAEPEARTVVIPSGRQPILFSLADEIARIERDWELA